MSDYNENVIAEFRANGGTVGDFGSRLVLIHHLGAKSGEERISPVAAQKNDDGWTVIASMGGSPKNPAWYQNLIAHPDVLVETPEGDMQVTVRELGDDEYGPAWERFTAEAPGFLEYAKHTEGRRMPILQLTPRAS